MIIEILMKRDGMKKKEAVARFNEVRSMIQQAIADGCDYDDVEEIMYEELGLEMDYIDEMLWI